jgi:hypothetical protein
MVSVHEILLLIPELLTDPLYIMVASTRIDKKNNLVRLRRNTDSCIQFCQLIVLLYGLLSHLFLVRVMPCT